ncbi:MAG: SDR family NAD(P)-dependent oxidoreductase [Desulfomonilaceae bacterium]
MGIFENKIALVTGAASGIGRALVEELIREKAKIVATDINEATLAANVEAMSEGVKQIQAFRLDVTDYDAFKKIIDDTISREGRLDYIFNNAGIAIAGDLRDVTIDDCRKVLDVNLNGVLYGSLLAYQQMAKQGFGHIVNLASIEGLIPFPTTVSYVMSKFAVMGLSQGMWVEGADLGVKVSAVCPGFVRTSIFDVSPVINMKREDWMKEGVSIWERFSVSSGECARKILKGVERNKPIITVSPIARVMWWLARVSPTFLMNFARKDFAKWRKKVRLVG